MRVLRKAVAWVVGLLLVVPGTTAAAAPPDGAPAGIEVTGERWIGDRLLELTVRSKALGGPATVRLLTPDGWEDRAPGERWPVLYLLAGGHGDPEAWTEA
ncbi:hypothetical protein ABZW67_26880 [Streptomyces rubiginosohelvolus]|uniref:hypothetical protein n=1 Tax=Streptomyces rubiginosohelvolus TaxID=67362 RepID=UPI0033BAF52D